MTKKNSFNEVSKIVNKVVKSRFDPLTKLVLAVLIVVPTLVILAVFTIIQFAIEMFRDSQYKEIIEEVNFKAIDTVYYEVCRVRATKGSLTQYVKFVSLLYISL